MKKEKRFAVVKIAGGICVLDLSTMRVAPFSSNRQAYESAEMFEDGCRDIDHYSWFQLEVEKP